MKELIVFSSLFRGEFRERGIAPPRGMLVVGPSGVGLFFFYNII